MDDYGCLIDLFFAENDAPDVETFTEFCLRYSKAEDIQVEEHQLTLFFKNESDLTMFLLRLPDEYQ